MQIARTQKDIKKGNLVEYHVLYVQTDTLLADVFENFRNVFLEIYELDPARFLTASGLAWQSALKKTKVKLGILSDIDMLLMVMLLILSCYLSICYLIINT